MEAGPWIRAARRCRRLSQRELAQISGVSLSTIARAESGANEPRLSAFIEIMAALGYEFLLVDWRGRMVKVDEVQERMRDSSGRRFPAHLRWGRTPPIEEGAWWGYFRLAWSTKDAPAYTYWKRSRVRQYRIGTNYGVDELWDDAT